MSRRIWKYVLEQPVSHVRMPADARILHIAKDLASDNPAVWAEVDPDRSPSLVHEFHVVGTGSPIPAGAAYLGTAHLPADGLVWHVFEGPVRT